MYKMTVRVLVYYMKHESAMYMIGAFIINFMMKAPIKSYSMTDRIGA